MLLDTDTLSPYFHAKLFFLPKDYDRTQHLANLRSQMTEKNGLGRVYLEIIDETQDTSIYVADILLKSAPTWLKDKDLIPGKKVHPLEDVENVLLICYSKNDTLFVHCTSEIVLDLFEAANSQLIVKLVPVNVTKMHQLASQKNLVFRTLGITNVFGTGGTAPEAKAYYGRNARHSLSITYDSGYGFSYFLGASVEKDKATAFGCSSKKRKVWGSWTKDMIDFRKKCDAIDEILRSGKITDTSPILVHPIDPPKLAQCKPWYFYMDYTIPRKGVVFLATADGEEYTSEWTCSLEDEGRTITYSIGAERPSVVRVSLGRVSATTPEWKFRYEGEATAFIKIHNETPNKDISKKHKKDLVEYLNENDSFTIVLSRGIAYREHAYWSDNRLSGKFTNINSTLSWAKTDIQSEFNRRKGSKLSTVASKVLDCLKSEFGPTAIIIQDHGTDEAADYVVISPKQLVLVHIKASAKSSPGLRIEDLQVVVSQALKNMRFFIPEGLLSRMDRLIQRTRVVGSPEELGNDMIAERIRTLLENYKIERILWLVQPGLSASKLSGNPANKAHALLNHLDGICTSNNVALRVVGST